MPDRTNVDPESSGIVIFRSKLDPDVWVPLTEDGDLSNFESPGRIRAVKRWCEDHPHVRGATSLRWVRVDEDTWSLDATFPAVRDA